MVVRELEDRKILHIVREGTVSIFAIVLNSQIARILFGEARKSEALAETSKVLNKLFEGGFSNLIRADENGKVVSLRFFLEEKMVELHPTSVAAADAYESHIRAAKPSYEQPELPSCF